MHSPLAKYWGPQYFAKGAMHQSGPSSALGSTPLTVRDRGLVPQDHQQEMVYGESNGHVIDDVTQP